jgi:hypothetical protein
MNFFKREHPSNNEKLPKKESKEDILVVEELKGDEFGPYRTPEEVSVERQHLLDLVKSSSFKKDDKKWTKEEIAKLEQEVSDILDDKKKDQ